VIYLEDIEFIRVLMSKDYKSLGFLTIGAIRDAHDQDRIIVYKENNERLGYIIFGVIKKDKDVRIFQFSVIMEKRRKGIGRKMFNEFLKFAKEVGIKGIRCRCVYESKANRFWKALGFKCIDTVLSKNRERYINIYYYPN